jgi:rhodanese-related sulfurtransferase
MSERQCEVSIPTAREMNAIGAGLLIDVRQAFELELEGHIPGAVHVPLFTFKHSLGKPLDQDEQEMLDAEEPDRKNAAMFVMDLNKLYFAKERPCFLCLCNSGRRSLYAAKLLSDLGYTHSYSVRGGWRDWRSPDHAAPEFLRAGILDAREGVAAS